MTLTRIVVAAALVIGVLGAIGYARHNEKLARTVTLEAVAPRPAHTQMTNDQKAQAYTTMRQQWDTIQRSSGQVRYAAIQVHTAAPEQRDERIQRMRQFAQLCYEQVAVYNRNAAILPPDLLTQPLPRIWGLADAIPLPVRIDPDDTCRI